MRGYRLDKSVSVGGVIAVLLGWKGRGQRISVNANCRVYVIECSRVVV
jgi:hypothetical protein